NDIDSFAHQFLLGGKDAKENTRPAFRAIPCTRRASNAKREVARPSRYPSWGVSSLCHRRRWDPPVRALHMPREDRIKRGRHAFAHGEVERQCPPACGSRKRLEFDHIIP